MKKYLIELFIIALLFCLAGCELDSMASRSKKASETADMDSLRNEVKRLGTELTLLKEQMDRFTQEQQDSLDAVKAAAARMDEGAKALKTSVDAKIAASEDRQNKMIKALDTKIDSAIKEVMAVLGKIKTGSASAGTGASSGTEKGFYHTVAEGESPWSIAQKYKSEYGASAQDILDANNMKSGDSIRPGQKLFIPVKK